MSPGVTQPLRAQKSENDHAGERENHSRVSERSLQERKMYRVYPRAEHTLPGEETMRNKIEITVFCRDKEVYLRGDRMFGYLAEIILDDSDVQRACLTTKEREKALREERHR